MTFTRNIGYALGLPQMPDVEIRFFPDAQTAITGLISGTVHVLGPESLSFNDDLAPLFAAAGQVNVFVTPHTTWEHLDFHLFPSGYYPVAVASLPPSGGVITNGAGVQLQFPFGALTSTTLITFTSQITASQPLTLPVLHSFSIVATTPDGQPVIQFQQPVMLTIDYTDAQLQALNVPAASLNVAYWDGAKWTNLLPCAGCWIDTANGRIIVVLTHLTEFAVTGGNPFHLLYLPLIRR